jgi:hypothetical protein
MTQLATDEDLVVGLCTHYEMAPTPSPTPTPIPHPFVATISDPARKAVQAITSSLEEASGELPEDRPLMIYGLPSTNTGTIAANTSAMPHVPFVGPWAPMPKQPIAPTGICESPPTDSPAAPAGNVVMDTGSPKCTFGKGQMVCLGHSATNCGEPSRATAGATVIATPKGGPVTGA